MADVPALWWLAKASAVSSASAMPSSVPSSRITAAWAAASTPLCSWSETSPAYGRSMAKAAKLISVVVVRAKRIV